MQFPCTCFKTIYVSLLFTLSLRRFKRGKLWGIFFSISLQDDVEMSESSEQILAFEVRLIIFIFYLLQFLKPVFFLAFDYKLRQNVFSKWFCKMSFMREIWCLCSFFADALLIFALEISSPKECFIFLGTLHHQFYIPRDW